MRSRRYPLKFDTTRDCKILELEYQPAEEPLTEHFQLMLDDGMLRAQA